MPSGARFGRLLLAALPLAVVVSVVTLYVVPSCRAAHGVQLAAKTRFLPTLVREEDIAPASLHRHERNFGNIIGPRSARTVRADRFTATLAVCAMLSWPGGRDREHPGTGRVASRMGASPSVRRGWRGARQVGRGPAGGAGEVRSRVVLLVAVAAFGLYTVAEVHMTAV